MLFSFGFLDFFNQLLLSCFFGGRHGYLLLTISSSELFGVLDLLFFFNNGSFDHDTVFDDVLNVFLFDFDCLFFFDFGKCHNALTLGDFETTIFFNTLRFDRVSSFFALGSYDDRSQTILFSNRDFFVGLNTCHFSTLTLLLLNNAGFRFLTSSNFSDFTFLFLFCVDLLSFKSQNRFLGFHVLLLERLFFFASNVVGQRNFLGRQFGNLLDTFGVQNVVRIQLFQLRLLKVVNRTVIQNVTVQVTTDYFENLLAEFFTGVVKFDKIELLTDGLERFGELWLKHLPQR